MIKCKNADGNGRCTVGGGACSAAREHTLSHAVSHNWIDKINGSYICGHENPGPINVEDADLSPQEDKNA